MSRDLPEEVEGAADDTLHEATIAELFMQQASRTPDAVALIAQDRQLTYRALDERSGRLAAHLDGSWRWAGNADRRGHGAD